jgi:hypothetical protein
MDFLEFARYSPHLEIAIEEAVDLKRRPQESTVYNY